VTLKSPAAGSKWLGCWRNSEFQFPALHSEKKPKSRAREWGPALWVGDGLGHAWYRVSFSDAQTPLRRAHSCFLSAPATNGGKG